MVGAFCFINALSDRQIILAGSDASDHHADVLNCGLFVKLQSSHVHKNLFHETLKFIQFCCGHIAGIPFICVKYTLCKVKFIFIPKCLVNILYTPVSVDSNITSYYTYLFICCVSSLHG